MSSGVTRGQLTEFFKSSIIWKDIEEELDIWLDEIHVQLENPNGDLSPRTLDRLGGNAETIRNVLSIGEVLLINYDIDQGE